MTNLADRPKLYISIAFITGILITLSLKDFYPNLERRYRRRRKDSIGNLGALYEKPTVSLEDHTKLAPGQERGPDIPVGIEGCIGNTPLFKIKSLSDATGCEILAKAEVWLSDG